MSFRSIDVLLRRNSKTKISRNIVEGSHDQKEEQYVQSLRKLLLATNQLPEKYDDYHVLLRFLRMRSFNILKAKEMFLNMLKWREDYAVDAIAKDFKFEEYDAVKRCYPHGFHGVDRFGRPLYIERIGLVNLNKLLQVTSIDRYIKYHIFEQEKTLTLRYPACSLSAKKHIASTTAILDVKGLGMNNFSKSAREMFIEIHKIDSNYYPETLNQLYIINAGSGFRALWKVLKAFLEARTLAKIQVLGSNYLSTILEAVDPRVLQLPEEFSDCQMECSSRQLDTSRRKQTLSMLLKDNQDNQVGNNPSEYIPRKHVNEQISQKIQELEGCAVEIKKILQTLESKQQELACHIEQLKKLGSG